MTLLAAPNEGTGFAREENQAPARLPDGRFPPGVSGNPSGRPHKGETMGDRLRAALQQINVRGVKASDEVVNNLVRLACSDEPHAVRAAELILDRIDGKVTIPIEVANVTLVLSQDDYDAVP